MTEIYFIKDKWARGFLLVLLLRLTVAAWGLFYPFENILSGLVLAMTVVLIVKKSTVPQKWYTPLCLAYTLLFTIFLGGVICDCIKVFLREIEAEYLLAGIVENLKNIFLILIHILSAILFLLVSINLKKRFYVLKEFFCKYGKRIFAILYVVYFPLSWFPVLFVAATGWNNVPDVNKARFLDFVFGLILGDFIIMALMGGLQYKLLEILQNKGDKKKRTDGIFYRLWQKIYEKQAVSPAPNTAESGDENTAEPAWCGDTYNPVIDIDSEKPAGAAVLSEEESERWVQYRAGTPLPPKRWEWRWEPQDGALDEETLLQTAPIYPFLKEDPKLQEVFYKKLREATEELEDFPATGSYETKKVKSFWARENACGLLVRLTGCAGYVENAAFSLWCNEE